MKTYLSVILLICSFFLFMNKGISQLKFNIHFESDSYVLSDIQKERISESLLSLKPENGIYRYTLVGHTDNVGRKGYNDTLSFKRAKAVEDFLIEKSRYSKDIFIDFKGLSTPVSPNTTGKGKALNRRVEIEVNTWDDFLLSDLKAKIPFRKIVYNNQNGLVDNEFNITVCKDAFVDSLGVTITGDIELFYQEYRKPSEFIALNKSLQFYRDQELYYYQSGGMYLLKATHKGLPVFLKEKCLEVNFNPNDSLPYKFYIFEETTSWVKIEQPELDIPDAQDAQEKTSSDLKNSKQEKADATQIEDNTKPVEAVCKMTCVQWISCIIGMYEGSISDKMILSHKKSLYERFKSFEYQGSAHYSTLRQFIPKDSVFGVSASVVKVRKENTYFRINVNGTMGKMVTPKTKYAFRMETEDFEQKIAGRKFSDYRIEKAQKGFNILFKDSSEMQSVPVVAYDLNKWIFKKRSKRRHRKILSVYDHDLFISDSIFHNYPRGNDSVPCILAAFSTIMTIPETEKALASEDWLDLFEYNRATYTNLLKPTYDIRGTFCRSSGSGGGDYLNRSSTKKLTDRSDLGLYNYDIEHKFNNEKHIVRNAYKDGNSNFIAVKKTFLYASKNNALIAIDPLDFWIDDQARNCLVMFDESGKLYIVSNSGISNDTVGRAKYIGDKNMNPEELENQILRALNE